MKPTIEFIQILKSLIKIAFRQNQSRSSEMISIFFLLKSTSW